MLATAQQNPSRCLEMGHLEWEVAEEGRPPFDEKLSPSGISDIVAHTCIYRDAYVAKRNGARASPRCCGCLDDHQQESHEHHVELVLENWSLDLPHR